MLCLYAKQVAALINTKPLFPQHARPSYESPHIAGTNTSVWRSEFLCGAHMFLLRVGASSECRTAFVIGLLTPERALLHYKYSEQNTPEGEDFCSRDLIQLLAAQPTLLIKGVRAQHQCYCFSILTQGPPGSVGIRGPLKNSVGHWSILTMSNSGSLFLPSWALPLYQPPTSGSAGHTN